MSLSVFDLFKIGIGPSSSHTVGPMRAARLFVEGLRGEGLVESVAQVRVELYGSLGSTGKGHGSDTAVLLGLMGEAPDTVDVDTIAAKVDGVRGTGRLKLGGGVSIRFSPSRDIGFHRQAIAEHPNGMKLCARDAAGRVLRERVYLSVGGGFVVPAGTRSPDIEPAPVPYPFATAGQLLAACEATGMSIADLMLANELTWRSGAEIRTGLLALWEVMRSCVERGCRSSGSLPGPLGVKRRARELHQKLLASAATRENEVHLAMDWLSLFAMAVNEENAAGGRVVTAPTNGAAGVIPAVLHYYARFIPGASEEGVIEFLLTAAAIGILYKTNASISGAEVGCQGEVGVACSMAAAGLCAAMGGTPRQVENAAEIGMEHHLGLTCDPVGGRVQIPCIERNAMGAVKAVNAARMALHGDGRHYVSLDNVMRAMMETGADMKTKYKETSRGGLAVNVIEC